MKRTLKLMILIVTIALPVMVYLFLKIFGENKYEIPIFYQEENNAKSPCKTAKYPHTIQVGEVKADEINRLQHDGEINIFSLLPSNEDFTEAVNQISRIIDHYREKLDLNFYLILENSEDRTPSIATYKNVVTLSASEFTEFIKCSLLIPDYFQIESSTELFSKAYTVLVDSHGRIRGYYMLQDMEEADRLIMEIEILNEYDNQ